MATKGNAAANKPETPEVKKPQSMKTLPTMKQDASLWTKSFVEFVARRGYEFDGRMKLQSGLDGREVGC